MGPDTGADCTGISQSRVPSVARKAAKVCFVVPSNTRLPAVVSTPPLPCRGSGTLQRTSCFDRIPGDQCGLLARIDELLQLQPLLQGITRIATPAAIGPEGLAA